MVKVMGEHNSGEGNSMTNETDRKHGACFWNSKLIDLVKAVDPFDEMVKVNRR